MGTSKVVMKHDTLELLPVRSLQVFLAVLECGSMTLAARSLNLTQPGVSMAIGELERMLNRPLLDRSVRPLRPTAAGRILSTRARKLVEDLQEIRSAIETSGAAILPSLNVGLISSATAAGPMAIKEMQGLSRELSVSSSGLTPDLVAALRVGLKDVLVMSDPMEGYEGIERHLILREPLVVAYPKGLGLVQPVDLDRLSSRLPMVHYTARSRLGAIVDQFLRSQRLKLARTLEFDTSAFFFPLIASGIGWAITTPLCILESRVDLGQIEISPIAGETAPARDLYAVAASGDLSDVAARIAQIFRKHLARQVENSFRGRQEWIVKAVEFPPAAPPAAAHDRVGP